MAAGACAPSAPPRVYVTSGAHAQPQPLRTGGGYRLTHSILHVAGGCCAFPHPTAHVHAHMHSRSPFGHLPDAGSHAASCLWWGGLRPHAHPCPSWPKGAHAQPHGHVQLGRRRGRDSNQGSTGSRYGGGRAPAPPGWPRLAVAGLRPCTPSTSMGPAWALTRMDPAHHPHLGMHLDAAHAGCLHTTPCKLGQGECQSGNPYCQGRGGQVRQAQPTIMMLVESSCPCIGLEGGQPRTANVED